MLWIIIIIADNNDQGHEDDNVDNKYILDVVFVISGIIKVEVKESVISQAKRPKLITLTETLIIPDITKNESNNCFITHCFEENKEFTQRWRRRQRERQKAMGLDKQNNNFARASRFFVHFSSVVARLQRETA